MNDEKSFESEIDWHRGVGVYEDEMAWYNDGNVPALVVHSLVEILKYTRMDDKSLTTLFSLHSYNFGRAASVDAIAVYRYIHLWLALAF